MVKKGTTSVNKEHNLNFDTLITTGEKEVSKRRTNIFFRLKQGEFIAFSDGKDKRIKFYLQRIDREKPKVTQRFSDICISFSFSRILTDIIFK